MILWKYLLIFAIVYCYKVEAKVAKYKSKLLSLNNCTLPVNEYDKDNIVYHTMSSRRVNRKTFVIASNYTVPKRTGPVSFNFRAYQMQRSSVRDLEFKLEKLSCTDNIMLEMIKIAKMKIDKDCYLLPGNYVSDNLSIDVVSHVFARSVMVAGQYAYDLETRTKKGVVSCVSIALEMI